MTEPSGSPRDLRRDIVFAFALALACYLAWLIRDVLVMLYVSALFAVVLTPMVRFTSQLRIGRWQPFKGSAYFSSCSLWPVRLPPSGSSLCRRSSATCRASPGRCHHACLHSLRDSRVFPWLNTWIPRISVPGFRVLSARRPLICCSRSATGRASYSISSWASFYRLFHSGRRSSLSLVSFLFPARTPRTARPDPAAG